MFGNFVEVSFNVVFRSHFLFDFHAFGPESVLFESISADFADFEKVCPDKTILGDSVFWSGPIMPEGTR